MLGIKAFRKTSYTTGYYFDMDSQTHSMCSALDARAREWPCRGTAWRAANKLCDDYVNELFAKMPANNFKARLGLSDDLLDQLANLYRSPIVIGGHMKSGTNLTAQLLDDHPSVLVLPGDSYMFQKEQYFNAMESQVFLCYWIKRLINPTGQGPFFFLASAGRRMESYVKIADLFFLFVELGKANIEALVSAMSIIYSKKRGILPKYWVEKTPNNHVGTSEFSCFGVPANYVFVYRSPTTNYLSNRELAKKRGWSGAGCIELSLNLRKSYKNILKQQRIIGAHAATLNYEDLVSDTQTEMKKLANWLGIKWRKSLLMPSIDGEPAVVNSMLGDHNIAGKVINTGQRECRVSKVEYVVISAIAGGPYKSLRKNSAKS